VDLSQTQDPQDAQHLGVELIDTSDSDNEGQSGLSWDVDLSGELGLPSSGDFSLVGGLVGGLVLLGTLEYCSSLLLVFSPALLAELLEGSGDLGLSLLLLLQALGFWGCLRHYHKRIKLY
jgi:hypothetical protein